MSVLRWSVAGGRCSTYQNSGPQIIPLGLLNLEGLVEVVLLALGRRRRRTIGLLVVLLWRRSLLLGRRVSLLVTLLLTLLISSVLLLLLASPLRLAILRLLTILRLAVAAVLTVRLRHSFVELVVVALRLRVRLGHQVRRRQLSTVESREDGRESGKFSVALEGGGRLE